jgi:hypothetical protein
VGLAVAALWLAAGAGAVTIHVHNTHDSGPGSLRQAVEGAGDGTTIVIPAGTYGLASGELSSSASLTFRGAGARKTVIDGMGRDRIYENSNGSAETVFSDVTIRNGDTYGPEGDASDGGGISVDGSLKLIRSAVVRNDADPNDGIVVSNGGGIYTAGSKLTVIDSLIAKNNAYNGGGVLDTGDRIVIRNSTIANNSAGSQTSGDNGDFGGIENNGATERALSSTIAFNSCFNGMQCDAGVSDQLTLRDSIVARNFGYVDNGEAPGSSLNPGVLDNCEGTGGDHSLGHNLSDSAQCPSGQASDRVTPKPGLKKLANNGGNTDTIALKASSKAIGHADSKAPRHDQRGFRRDSHPDIGAFEFGAAP